MYGSITMAVINILTGIHFLCHAEKGQFVYVLPLMLIITGSLLCYRGSEEHLKISSIKSHATLSLKKKSKNMAGLTFSKQEEVKFCP